MLTQVMSGTFQETLHKSRSKRIKTKRRKESIWEGKSKQDSIRSVAVKEE